MSNTERSFNHIETLREADDLGVMPGYIDFSEGWAARSGKEIPEGWETKNEDDDSPNEEAVRGLGQISALTIARQNEAMQNINEKRRQQS